MLVKLFLEQRDALHGLGCVGKSWGALVVGGNDVCTLVTGREFFLVL